MASVARESEETMDDDDDNDDDDDDDDNEDAGGGEREVEFWSCCWEMMRLRTAKESAWRRLRRPLGVGLSWRTYSFLLEGAVMTSASTSASSSSGGSSE